MPYSSTPRGFSEPKDIEIVLEICEISLTARDRLQSLHIGYFLIDDESLPRDTTVDEVFVQL
jgi:hypothetical protein